jgi:hypothetical protein
MALHPQEFAFADATLAEAYGLPPRDDDWGLLFCLDDRDLRYTVAGSGDFLRTLLGLPPGHDINKPLPPIPNSTLGIDELPPEAFPLTRRKWPDQWDKKERRAPWDPRADDD